MGGKQKRFDCWACRLQLARLAIVYDYPGSSIFLPKSKAGLANYLDDSTYMIRTLLKSKIHRATVTEAELHYEGSVSIDEALLELADIREHEQVDIYNITSGTRLTTYAIVAERNSGRICINGAAAHLMKPGEMVIICSYAQYQDSQGEQDHSPVVVHVDQDNRPLR